MFLPKEIDKIFVIDQQTFHNQEPLQLIDELYSGRFNQLQLMIFFLPLLSGSRKNLPKNFSICIKMTGIINHHRDQITLGKIMFVDFDIASVGSFFSIVLFLCVLNIY